jgi:hypothetical protein
MSKADVERRVGAAAAIEAETGEPAARPGEAVVRSKDVRNTEVKAEPAAGHPAGTVQVPPSFDLGFQAVGIG